jgi:hypothetical protein
MLCLLSSSIMLPLSAFAFEAGMGTCQDWTALVTTVMRVLPYPVNSAFAGALFDLLLCVPKLA